ncbi:MAG TPA: transketolase [Bacillota bacterium]
MNGHLRRLETIPELARKARQLRRDVVDIVYHARSGHPGGALGMADVLTVLWYHFLRDDPSDPDWPDRDRFVLSNGHVCPILYAILADRGYFDQALLKTFRRLGSPLQGHPSVRKGLPGVEYSGGSLGNGLSFALGMALAARVSGRHYRVFCSVGDGDCQEGQTWEAAMAAAHYRVGNLNVVVDFNRSQIDGPTDEIMSLGDLAAKWAAFGWHVQEIDGHDYEQILAAWQRALAEDRRPSVIVARTVIGKGVSYMEGDYRWHHGAPNEQQYRQAMAELADDAAD